MIREKNRKRTGTKHGRPPRLYGGKSRAIQMDTEFMTPLYRDKKATRAKKRAGRSNTWVTQTLKKMTLREKLGQMLMVSYFGAFHPAESPAYKEILHEVEENHVRSEEHTSELQSQFHL